MKDHTQEDSQTPSTLISTDTQEQPVIVLGEPPNNATQEQIEQYWPTITTCEDDGK